MAGGRGPRRSRRRLPAGPAHPSVLSPRLAAAPGRAGGRARGGRGAGGRTLRGLALAEEGVQHPHAGRLAPLAGGCCRAPSTSGGGGPEASRVESATRQELQGPDEARGRGRERLPGMEGGPIFRLFSRSISGAARRVSPRLPFPPATHRGRPPLPEREGASPSAVLGGRASPRRGPGPAGMHGRGSFGGVGGGGGMPGMPGEGPGETEPVSPRRPAQPRPASRLGGARRRAARRREAFWGGRRFQAARRRRRRAHGRRPGPPQEQAEAPRRTSPPVRPLAAPRRGPRARGRAGKGGEGGGRAHPAGSCACRRGRPAPPCRAPRSP